MDEMEADARAIRQLLADERVEANISIEELRDLLQSKVGPNSTDDQHHIANSLADGNFTGEEALAIASGYDAAPINITFAGVPGELQGGQITELDFPEDMPAEDQNRIVEAAENYAKPAAPEDDPYDDDLLGDPAGEEADN